jgi:hypothetical protein
VGHRRIVALSGGGASDAIDFERRRTRQSLARAVKGDDRRFEAQNGPALAGRPVLGAVRRRSAQLPPGVTWTVAFWKLSPFVSSLVSDSRASFAIDAS